MTVFIKARWLTGKALLGFVLVMFAACGTGTDEKETIDRARGYYETRDLNAATLELKNVLVKNAKNAEARYLLGQVHLVLGSRGTPAR